MLKDAKWCAQRLKDAINFEIFKDNIVIELRCEKHAGGIDAKARRA